MNHLKAIQTDLILLSGDVIDDRNTLPELEAFLKGLSTAIKVATLGNWEHWSGADLKLLSALYKRHEVKLLVNECLLLVVNGVHFSLAWLNDSTARQPDLIQTLEQFTQGEPIILTQNS